MKRVYLDYAATTPTRPEVVTAMMPYYTEIFGNPSSIYACAHEARQAVEEARGKIARLIGARDEEVFFTGGGSEADNTALIGIAFANEKKGNHIITSAIEHHAVIETCHFLKKRGFKITYLPVDKAGLVDPERVKKAINSKTILISVMYANNEIGTIEPIAEVGRIAKEAGVYFHTDAVQALGHLPINVDTLGLDLLSASGHKLYGPKGIGALYVRKRTKITSLIHGGGQERGRRAGTENVPGMVGFGRAVELAQQEMTEEAPRLIRLRDRLISGLLERIEHSRLNGHPQQRLPNNVNISIPFVEGEAICLNLDLVGICASSGSACSSSSAEPSHVLLALGLSYEEARGSLRLSLGKWTSDDDIELVLDHLPSVVTRIRSMSPLLRIRD